MLSKYCSDIAKNYGIKVGGVKKLISNLGNKSKCIVHYQNLYLYLALGTKLTKVHKTKKQTKKYAANSLENFFLS